ncbi:MAG: aminotransferase class I/II-fold pyridoxal phosphate-dependent enzyme [Erysipelotrichaceae bacterium]|nr:aminotransferase class I/II-fold pyridoxal phosphate-dependent enzyme [Erysipelotrichaceae bacterium]
MIITPFDSEVWMTEHELDYKYNMTESCMEAMTLKDVVDEDSLKDLMNGLMDYGPIMGSDRLKDAILGWYDTGSRENISLAFGAINANELVLMELLEAGDEVISLYPSYGQLYDLPISLGCKVKLIELKKENNWLVSIDDFKKVISKDTKLICLNSPNNPTGTFISLDLMLQIVELAKENDCYILCDEIYRGLNTQTGKLAYSVSDIYDKGIVTQSLSKVFSYAGLRCGWIKAPKDIIKRIDVRRDYHIISLGPVIDKLSTLVLENKDKILERNLGILRENKAYLREWLKKEEHIECVIPEEGTVCLLTYDFDIPSKVFCEKLQKETGVFFIPGACYGVEKCMRLGLTHHKEEFQEGLEVFSNWLKTL